MGNDLTEREILNRALHSKWTHHRQTSFKPLKSEHTYYRQTSFKPLHSEHT